MGLRYGPYNTRFLAIDVPSMLVDSGLPDDKVAMLRRETAVVAAVAAAVAAALHEAVPEGMAAAQTYMHILI